MDSRRFFDPQDQELRSNHTKSNLRLATKRIRRRSVLTPQGRRLVRYGRASDQDTRRQRISTMAQLKNCCLGGLRTRLRVRENTVSLVLSPPLYLFKPIIFISRYLFTNLIRLEKYFYQDLSLSSLHNV